jgi:hypothetical protein
VGTSVTIAGANFGASQGTSAVTFNATTATPTNWSATSIIVPVPAGATTGPVVVTVGGLATNGITFTVIQAAAVTATWNANTETDIAGYVLSYGTQTGVYSTRADVGNVTTWQGPLTAGVGYYFAVQAYNTSLQFSPYSAEVFHTVAGTASMLTLMAPANPTRAQKAAVAVSQAANHAALTTPTIIHPTLAAFWQLNDGVGTTAFDASGHGMNGILVNSPMWTAGRLGGALSFNGLGDHVTTKFVENLTTWTVAVWVRSPAAPSSASGSGPVQREKNFEINWNHPDVALRGAVALSAGGTWHAASFGPLAANTWYHLVGTYDGDTLRAYVNGVLATANPAPSGNPDLEPLPLELGARAGAASYFAGVVSGVRIYRRAIGPSEVAVLAQHDATPPTAVTVSASPNGQGVSLSWTAAADPNSGVSLYRIYRGTTVGGAKSPLAEGLAGGLSYQDSDTTPFTTYYYEVSAVNGNGVEGMRSNEAVVTSQIAPAPAAELTATPR